MLVAQPETAGGCVCGACILNSSLPLSVEISPRTSRFTQEEGRVHDFFVVLSVVYTV